MTITGRPSTSGYSPNEWSHAQLADFARDIDPYGGHVDLGIVRAVQILLDADVSTFESCEGGEGHIYAVPTIRFHGDNVTGWRALSVLLTYGMPVDSLARTWDVVSGEPTGPYWDVTFSRLL